jgi:predicted PurR-regulated permease PerM
LSLLYPFYKHHSCYSYLMVDRKLQLHFLLILLVGVLVVSFFIVRPFILTVILAVIFAITLSPLYKKILVTFHNRKTLASLITVAITVVCMAIPLLLIFTQIFKESVDLYGSIARGEGSKSLIMSAINGTGRMFENFVPGAGEFFSRFSENIDVYLKGGLSWVIDHLAVVLSGVSVWLLDLFIFFVSLYYLLRDGDKMLKGLIKLSPLDKEDMKIIFKRVHLAVNSVIKGNLLIALLQGSLTAVGFAIFTVPNALLWGAVAVITALIPGVGTGIIILPGILYLFITNNIIGTIGLTVWGVFIVGLVDNLLRPKLVGEALSLHPLLILLSIIGGLFLFGPIGLFLGPIIMSLLFAFLDTYGDIMEKMKD